MRKTGLSVALALWLVTSISGLASTNVVPTTTLSAETGNNTSAADSFQGTNNGNEAATNVSKVDIHSLLYSGANTKIFAHFMPWFGQSGHINVGYNSADPTQVANQVSDMISRGIQGVIIDWYGRNFSHEDTTTQYMMAEVQKHSGFQFALMEDAGCLKSNAWANLVADLTYAWQKYEQSGNYLKINGHPVVFFFGVEGLGLPLANLASQVPGSPIFIVENNLGFSASYSGGAFAWANGFTSDHVNNWGQAYLDSFYAAAKGSSRPAFGGVWKGFNDTIASWSSNRVLGQRCGQTWLSTFSDLNSHYSGGSQLQNLQLVTWNDYEEGTGIEMGIDNCVSISASASGNTLTWSISGNENTINHYTVFISKDGQNLMPVTDVASGVHSLDLSQFGFPAGAYNVYVKAVGQPSMRNHMSGAVGYTATGAVAASTNPPANTDLSLTVNPSSVQVLQGGSASTTVTLTPKGNYNVPVALSCTGLPAGVNCLFSSVTLTPGSAAAKTSLTITANGSTALLFGFGGSTLAMWLPGLGFGMVISGKRKLSKKFWIAVLTLSLGTIIVATGCGGVTMKSAKSTGGSASSSAAASVPGTYTFQIVGQSGSFQRSATATVVVQ